MDAAGKTTWLLAIGAIGAVAFVVVFSILGAVQSGYRPSREPVSALVPGDYGWVQIVNFVATGLAVGALAVGVRQALPGTAAVGWGSALLGVVAVGLVASGVFIMDAPVGDASIAGGPTWHGRLHDVFGLVVFTSLPAAAIMCAAAVWSVEGLRWFAVVSVLAGIACAGLFVAFAAAAETGADTAGAWQRASILVGWAWLAGLGITLLVHVQDTT